jgi:hypothetical protein
MTFESCRNRREIAGSWIGNVAREWHAEWLEARGSAMRVFHVPVQVFFFIIFLIFSRLFLVWIFKLKRSFKAGVINYTLY